VGAALLTAGPLSGIARAATAPTDTLTTSSVPLTAAQQSAAAGYPATEQAVSTFGSAQWSQAQQITAIDGSFTATGFLIPLAERSATLVEVLGAAGELADAFVMTTAITVGALQLEFLSTTGSPLGQVQIPAQAGRAATVTAITPDTRKQSFLDCIGSRAPRCLDICVTCEDPIGCVICIGCAGGAAVYCAARSIF
jgi:hypothetical protein